MSPPIDTTDPVKVPPFPATPVISAETHAALLNDEAHQLNTKERLSAYFTIAAAAFGLVSDGYQNNIMIMANVVFMKLYPKTYTAAVATRVSNSLLVGSFLGQFFVGLVCDRVGRKMALVATTLLIVIGATLCTAARGSPDTLFWLLTVGRGIAGVGVGGEYPASSTSASEAANEKMLTKRGPVFIMVTHFVLVLGSILAVSVFLIVLLAAGVNHLETVWRVCFGIGIALPMTVFYFRLRMLSSKLYRRGAIKRQVPYRLVAKRYWKTLIGTCGTWFLYSFIIYPNGVFSGTIIASAVHGGDIKRTGEWQLLLATIVVPGVLLGALLCNPLGRRGTMMIGFSGYLVFGLIIGLMYDKLTKNLPLFVILYGIMQACGNLGPGDMLNVVGVESFATPVRGSLYGLSSAIGRIGAVVGTQAFAPIQQNLGKRWTFIIAAISGITGVFVTYFFIPDMTGVDLTDEDAKFMRYLTENGWEGHVGEDEEEVHVKGSSTVNDAMGSEEKLGKNG